MGKKMLNIDDVKIKELICVWQTDRKEIFLDKIKENLVDLIYQYPARIFGKDENECSAFYEHICERIEGILEKYTALESRFSTWFFIVLRHQYFNWSKMERRKDRIHSIRMTTVGKNSEAEIDLSDDRQFHDWNGSERESITGCDDARENAVRDIFDRFRPEQKLVVSVLYYDLDVESLSRIYQGKRDIMDVFEQYSHFKHETAERRNVILTKFRNLNEKIPDLKWRLMSLEKSSLRSEDHEKKCAKLRRDILKCEEFRIRASGDLMRQGMNMPYDWVAEVLGWPETKVRKTMFYIKQRFLKYFQEHKGLL